MNIKTTKKSIEELGLEILDLCPMGHSEDYVDGYVDFVSFFIGDVKILYGLIENSDGSSYIDIAYTCESTNRTIKIEAFSQPLLNKEEYLAGSLKAELAILNAFIFEFGVRRSKVA